MALSCEQDRVGAVYGADASGAGHLQGSIPFLGLKAPLCHQAEQGQAPWDPTPGLCVFPEPLENQTAKLRMLFVSCPQGQRGAQLFSLLPRGLAWVNPLAHPEAELPFVL